jgi:OHCU decarboxylase
MRVMSITLAELNEMGKESFIEAIGWVYEHSPWVVERAWSSIPFSTLESLHEHMNMVVTRASYDEALRLIRAHPDLATRIKMTEASQQEQKGAGLDQLIAEEFNTFSKCNSAYIAKFGFPFILAVRGKGKEEILASMQQRLNHNPEQEFQRALQEIGIIAGFRLKDTITIE